ncbi:DUF1667 domain-containing protein [Breznakiella homolactica]|uniref:DUF1667 domain-containing protein n=1 Tax=Breznakiella homolactica TaxID=2798577 RepID=A0A7T8BAE6_9SPIR|nr:DUF1667 domain-containing protein [Breznakiella homolactica]QQO09437.1 DUF1667 domain-containing protein [Breznakiella homolactica]
MRSLTCIVCPIGCSLSVEEREDGEIIVSGNRCPRGAVYAQEEIRSPKRVVTATCRLTGNPGSKNTKISRHGISDPRRLPVKTSAPCPKEQIGDLLADIYAAEAEIPVKSGDRIIADWKGTGIDVIAVRTIG